MNKKKNIFTKENYAYLCEAKKTFEDPFKLKKNKYLHIPEEKLPICYNLHKELEGQTIKKFFKKKKVLYDQIVVSNKKLDCILNEIGEKETKKRLEKGVILNLNRKKIFDIINIYTEVLKYKGVDEKKKKDEEIQKKKKLLKKEEIDEMREINHKLVGMVSNNKKKNIWKRKI